MPTDHGTRPHRREFLRFGLAGLGGLTWADLLRRRAVAAISGQRRGTALLVVWLHGGASHLETYDPKPSAPAEYRGPYDPIPTAVPHRYTHLRGRATGGRKRLENRGLCSRRCPNLAEAAPRNALHAKTLPTCV